jgi:hypothetical protein
VREKKLNDNEINEERKNGIKKTEDRTREVAKKKE